MWPCSSWHCIWCTPQTGTVLSSEIRLLIREEIWHRSLVWECSLSWNHTARRAEAIQLDTPLKCDPQGPLIFVLPVRFSLRRKIKGPPFWCVKHTTKSMVPWFGVVFRRKQTDSQLNGQKSRGRSVLCVNNTIKLWAANSGCGSS